METGEVGLQTCWHLSSTKYAEASCDGSQILDRGCVQVNAYVSNKKRALKFKALYACLATVDVPLSRLEPGSANATTIRVQIISATSLFQSYNLVCNLTNSVSPHKNVDGYKR